ncbi:MAG: hypothetical protein JXR68_07595 [Bacteroidales bacterium]|nr:hypothetical protein [Bacteroidales bacterium]
MKYIKLLFVAVLVIFSACEGPIYHEYEVVNNSDKPVEINVALADNPDSVFQIIIEVDSTKVIFETDDMQGFFSEKVPPQKSTEIFASFNVKQDSIVAKTNFLSDSLWVTTYKPGIYRYRLQIISEDF